VNSKPSSSDGEQRSSFSVVISGLKAGLRARAARGSAFISVRVFVSPFRTACLMLP
jgi:hypothetical protein